MENSEPERKPRIPVKLSFQNVEMDIETKLTRAQAKKYGIKYAETKVLKGVSGYALPGQTVFIMGASGSGKTSLLNILSDRITPSSRGIKISGKVLINDTRALNEEVFGSIAGYVMQDDILFMHFTPRQALTFAARLKLNSLSRQE